MEPTPGREHRLHTRVRADLGAERLRGAPDRIGDRAHAALLVAPGSEVTVADVADRVVEHHVRGPGLVRPRPRPDDAVHREHALDRVGLEPVVQQVRDAHREQSRDVADATDPELAHLPCGARRLEQVADRERAGAGRALQEQRPQDVGDALQPCLPLGERVRVLLRELRDRVARTLGLVGVDHDRAAVGERLEVGAERRDVVAVLLELELVDDRRRHQRHHVGVGGDVDLRVIRERGARVGGAARLVPRLENHGLRAMPGEVGPCRQPVMPPADHDRVVGVRLHPPSFLWPRLHPRRDRGRPCE